MLKDVRYIFPYYLSGFTHAKQQARDILGNMWSRRIQLGMLRCSQQVAEHNATGTCMSASPLFCSFPSALSPPLLIFTDPYFLFHCNTACRKTHATSTALKNLLQAHIHTFIEGEHQQLEFVFSFSKKTALILPDKGWESQENISAHTHTQARQNMPRHYPFTDGHWQGNTRHSCPTHTDTSELVAFYLNCLCHRFQSSLAQLG